ncbi:MAG: flagellar filament capping protein FliD [Spirochaetales bacterium]|nr:flagellar filament capping protein FliD [Spirochaetales bacterium]
MPDIVIPGVNSGLNTDKIVSKLMELERIPLKRKEDERDTYESEKTIWQDLSQNISKLQDTAKGLYGANNPFNERIAESSNEKVITAVASRNAVEQEKEITVLQKASADRFLSDSMDKEFDAPSGSYEFAVGDEEISFNFRGGTLERLADRINSRGRDMLRAQVIKDSPDTSVLLIESTKEGYENKLEFKEGSALEFAIASGILKRTDSSLRIIPPLAAAGSTGVEAISGKETLIKPGAAGSFPIDPPVIDNGKLLVEFKVTINDLEQQKWVPPTPPPGPEKPNPGNLSFKGVYIENADSIVKLPSWEKPQPPEKIENLEVFSSGSEGTKRNFPSLRDTASVQTISLKLSQLGGKIDSIIFQNNNTYKEITISEIKIYDPDARGEWEPARPIAQAANSRLMIDGIEISRKSNTIEDLIPGVTLTLKGENEEAVTLNITPDREQIKDKIINFVGSYNRLQADLGILTTNDGAIISELDYFTEEETKTAKERIGYFQGDSTLIQMKSRLQMLMMEPYSTTSSDSIRMLSQIGISTNSSGYGSGVNNSKLRGYIEINEDELDAALDVNIQTVKDLFGRDSDGDLIIDSGAAYKTQEYSKPFTGTNGIISYRISSLDSRIDRTERDIANYELKMIDKEAELKNKYATMEGNLNSMRQSSNSINSLNNNN